MKKIEVLKSVTGLVVSIGVGAIVDEMIINNTSKPKNVFQAGCMLVGAFALSSMVSDKVVTHVENEIDDVINNIKEIQKEFKNNKIETDTEG